MTVALKFPLVAPVNSSSLHFHHLRKMLPETVVKYCRLFFSQQPTAHNPQRSYDCSYNAVIPGATSEWF